MQGPGTEPGNPTHVPPKPALSLGVGSERKKSSFAPKLSHLTNKHKGPEAGKRVLTLWAAFSSPRSGRKIKMKKVAELPMVRAPW